MEADGYACRAEFNRRAGTTSPPRDRTQQPTAVELAADVRLDEIGRTVASVQEFVEMAARVAEAERAFRKAEKLRKREEEQLAMAKVVEVQLLVRLRDIREEIRAEVCKALSSSVEKSQTKTAVTAKGKDKVIAIEDFPSTSGTSNDVEAITEGAGNLSIQEKRKRGEDTPVGCSPPVTTPAKRISKQMSIRPVRLSECLQRMSTKIAVRRPTKGAATKALTAMKPTAKDSMMELMLFLDSSQRELSKLDYDTLRAFCREEGVNYTTKVQAIFDLADRRAQLRFGEQLPEFGTFESSEEGAHCEVRR
ncbi:hypothetical protein CBR_g40351 [Chara braunii]|uniref:Uncharacterized protein n=1 Tax=Chara braunii TaxID=69332 RepID=A0A388LTQ7_CHABU|nr:hypothetical protein CBR_g40351 [Chara braunii]|eukprot:GBG85623.1 hypothetical protein CBR_g40351 [Chara braunii]